MPTQLDPDELLNQFRVSVILGTTVKFLEHRRLRGGGPPFYKIGRLVRYKRGEVVAWVDARRRTSTSETHSPVGQEQAREY